MEAKLRFAERALEAAGVGGWELDIATGRLTWTPMTFVIHELEPGEPPTLEVAIAFYPPEIRPLIDRTVAEAVRTGAAWDLELPFVTAKGRHIWVRACGRAIREGGETVRLTGAFQDVTARRALVKEAERLSVVARQMTNAVIITDAQGRTEWLNDAFCRLTGYGLLEMGGIPPGRILQGPETDPETARHMRDRVAGGDGFDVEIINYTRAGHPYWMAITCTPLRDDSGTLTGFIGVETDVTARRRAEEGLRREAVERDRAEALLRDVLEALPSAVTAYDSNERLILYNRAYAEMFPIAARFATPGRSLEDIVRLAARDGQYPEAGATQEERDRWISAHIASHRAPGEARTIRLPEGRFAQAREQRSSTGNLVCVRSDTTELKRAEAELRVRAEHDPLTGLANRSAFRLALERVLDADPCFGALLMFDVDHFKPINDTLGHDVGDALLIEVASRLRANARAGDVPARLGGDEFAVVMPGLADRDAVTVGMNRVQAALAAPVEIGARRLDVTISAGVTLFPLDGTDAEQLLKNADLALYEAKRTGRARWCLFRPEQAEALERHVLLASGLRRALAEDRIDIALQPKPLLRGGHDGFEAVARWHDGTRWVSSEELAAVAEESGLAVPLGRRVMDLALGSVRSLRDRGLRPGRIAVNVSGRHLLEPDFVANMLESLHRHGLAPGDLELEVTESVLLGRTAALAEKQMHEIRQVGVSLALDEFGTGFAGLTHLCRLPIDRLKIDKSFVAEIGTAGRGGLVVRAVIGLARSLGLEVVADGVETQEQLEFLRAEACDAGQGALFSPPLRSMEEIAAFLRAVEMPSRNASERV